jgi:hypothetical protein
VPFCPSCRTEYREGVPVCSDCGAELVAELPPPGEPEDWVTVEETGEETLAAIVRGFLEDRGLAVRVLDRHDRELSTTIGELSTIEVQVRSGDLQRALAELESLDEEAPVEDEWREPEASS